MPTAVACVSDLIEVSRNIQAEAAGHLPMRSYRNMVNRPVRSHGQLRSHYYMRFGVLDRPGVLGQLANVLESTHPDPYHHGGGRIAFHRRLHKVLDSIPQEGMTRDEFIKLLRPFVAAIGDQHTSIYTDYETDSAAPGGLPFVFEPIEKSLYVLVPFSSSDNEYIGSRLVSVEGVPLANLVERF